MSRPTRSKAILWLLLSIPAVAIAFQYLAEPEPWPGDLLAPTGEWSARLLIFALMLTPLAQLLPGNPAIRWLVRHRRAFGVAAFGYALLHLAAYVVDMETVANMVAEIGAPAIWTAWLALLCLLPPALASNDSAVRRLGRAWKRVQRFAYPAALFTLLHWALVHDGLAGAALHFAPLALLQIIRIVRNLFRPNQRSFA